MQRFQRAKGNFATYLILGWLALGSALLFIYQTSNKNSLEGQYRQIQIDFQENEEKLNSALANLISTDSLHSTVDLVNFCQKRNLDMDKIAFFVYKDSLLAGWSSNTINMPHKISQNDTPDFLSIDNKWVYMSRLNKDNYQYVGCIIIANNYDNLPYYSDNKIIYIPPNKSPPDVFLKTIVDNNQAPIFKVSLDKNIDVKTSTLISQIILLLLGITFWAIALIKRLLVKKFFQQRKTLIFIISASFIFVATRLILLLFDNSCELFSPIFYVSHFNSLGELFVHVFAIFLSSAFFMQLASLRGFYNAHIKTRITLALVSMLLMFGAIIFIYALISGITNDSIVVLKPELIYQYDLLSVIALLSIVMLLWSGFFILYKLLSEVFNILRNNILSLYIIGGGLLGFTILNIIFVKFSSLLVNIYLLLLAFGILVGIISIFIYKRKKWYNLLFQGLLFIILSFTVWLTAHTSVKEREEKYMETMAKDILSVEDAFISDELCELAEKLEKDSALAALFAQTPFEQINIQQFIVSEYLNPYPGKYNIRVYAGLQSSPEDKLRMEKILLNTSPDTKKETTSVFFFNRINFGRSEYVLNLYIPIHNCTDFGRLIIIFIKDAYHQQQIGLGKLLRKEMSYFSYAGYENGLLVSTSNPPNIAYHRLLSDYRLDTLYTGMKFTSDEMTHTVFVYGQKTLIISSGNDIVWMQLSFIGGLFLMQFAFFMLVSFFFLPLGSPNPWGLGFRESIQLYTAMLILIAILATGFLFFNFFDQMHQKEHTDNINQSVERVRKTITASITSEDSIYTDPVIFNKIESTLNHLYGSDLPDINIYNPSGIIVKSFGRGIFTSPRINPLAYQSLSANPQEMRTFNEIFDLRAYKSYYNTILNSKGEIQGYINHIYFKSRAQRPFDRRHIQFLSKFMTIGILSLIIITAISLLLVKRLTIPLHKVIRHLSEFNSNPQSMKSMKKIEWNHHDEFGELVETYNLLIERIVVSAELVERTAQEMTWKDMAKQVAHEIKNPLTPIRLSTQQILREINNNEIDKEKITHCLTMIIEQTDVLNEIATSFSNFAKVHLQNGSPEDLISIIENNVTTFEENENEIIVQVENHTHAGKAMCYTNRVQITQVLNNLIKNATQAARPHQKQIITISLHHYGDKMWQIQVSDTGVGMTNEMKEKIFSPNFTTKAIGMGLGLALVKSIVSSWGGSIYFESTLDVGTTFFINLPKYVKQDS